MLQLTSTAPESYTGHGYIITSLAMVISFCHHSTTGYWFWRWQM